MSRAHSSIYYRHGWVWTWMKSTNTNIKNSEKTEEKETRTFVNFVHEVIVYFHSETILITIIKWPWWSSPVVLFVYNFWCVYTLWMNEWMHEHKHEHGHCQGNFRIEFGFTIFFSHLIPHISLLFLSFSLLCCNLIDSNLFNIFIFIQCVNHFPAHLNVWLCFLLPLLSFPFLSLPFSFVLVTWIRVHSEYKRYNLPNLSFCSRRSHKLCDDDVYLV